MSELRDNNSLVQYNMLFAVMLTVIEVLPDRDKKAGMATRNMQTLGMIVSAFDTDSNDSDSNNGWVTKNGVMSRKTNKKKPMWSNPRKSVCWEYKVNGKWAQRVSRHRVSI